MNPNAARSTGDAPDLAIREAIDLYCRRKRPQWKGETERTYRRDLGTFADYADESELETLSDLERWSVSGYTDYLLDQDYAKVTVASRQKSVKTWLKFLEGQGYLPVGLHLAIDTIKLEDGEETSDQKLAPDDARTLLEFYRNSATWRGRRRHALLEVLWHVGCRFSCVSSLDLSDYDQENGVLKFRNRPNEGTRLKNGRDHERNVALSPAPKEILDLFVARERLDKRDDHGREPLFPSRQGRPARSTVRGWCYEATQPCMAAECPHSKRRPNCEWVPRDQASKCPSTRPTHAIRSGSITWQLNLGFDPETVAKRVAATPGVIRRYYDKPDYDEDLRRRREETQRIDITEHLDPHDLEDDS